MNNAHLKYAVVQRRPHPSLRLPENLLWGSRTSAAGLRFLRFFMVKILALKGIVPTPQGEEFGYVRVFCTDRRNGVAL